MSAPYSSQRAGFTLVELLVVIAIIATLAGLLVPTIMIAQERTQRTTCLSNLKQIGQLAMIYANDHKDVFPLAPGSQPRAYESLQLLVDEGLAFNPGLFVCPASNDDVEALMDEDGAFQLGEQTNSYAWLVQRTA